jgi:hypothetical protein
LPHGEPKSASFQAYSCIACGSTYVAVFSCGISWDIQRKTGDIHLSNLILQRQGHPANKKSAPMVRSMRAARRPCNENLLGISSNLRAIVYLYPRMPLSAHNRRKGSQRESGSRSHIAYLTLKRITDSGPNRPLRGSSIRNACASVTIEEHRDSLRNSRSREFRRRPLSVFF